MSERSGSNGVAWLALLVSLVALVLAWKAYQREGGVLFNTSSVPQVPQGQEKLDQLGDRLDASRDTLQRKLALAEARIQLLAQRAETAVDRNLDRMSEEVGQARQNLDRSYSKSSEEVRARWRQTDEEMKKVQEDLKRGNQKAMEELDRLLAKLRLEEESDREEKPR